MAKELTILIVDDAVINRGILKNIFEADYGVLEAANGREALEVLQRESVDIILLDIIMPEMDGIEFLQIIKKDERLKEIPVLVNSLADEYENELTVYELGAHDFIRKPYNPVVVKRKVDNIVSRYINIQSTYKTQMEKKEQLLDHLAEMIPGGVCLLELKEGHIYLLDYSDGFCRLLGYPKELIVARGMKAVDSHIYAEDLPNVIKVLGKLGKSETTVQCSFRVLDLCGDSRWITLIARFLENTENGICLQAIVTEDQKELDNRHTQQIDLLQSVELDILTGIYNCKTFYEKAAKLIGQNYVGVKYIICTWNVDNFKVVNALFGNKAGDNVLKCFAEYLTAMFQEEGVVGRLGADHFVVCTTMQFFSTKKEEIVSVLAGKKKWNHLNYPILFHAGVYEIRDKSIPVSIMCDRAALALESVRNNYLNRIAYYDASLKKALLEEQQLINEMESALESGQFFIQLQPIVSTKTGLIESAEALVRWNHPVKGVIPPSVFIPLFEKNEFVTKIDLFVCEEVCKFQKKRKEEGKEIVPVSINLSRLNFYNSDICRDIIHILSRYGLTQEYIKIEVTETVLRNNQQFLAHTVDEFHKNGFLILMDDFGSGYSSLDMLKEIYVDVLKIDMKFMDDIETSERAHNILYSIIQLAKSLHIQTVAEGVETREQYNLLRSMDCDMVQGFYFSRPVMPAEYEELIVQNHEEYRKTDETQSQRTILVVDDVEMMRDALEAVLKDDYYILKAKDGLDALNCLKENFADIDLVLSDIYMPDHDGYELLENMKKLDCLRDIPVLMVTAYGEIENEKRALELGALDVINKPFDSRILRKRIDNLLNNSRTKKAMMEAHALRESMKIKSRIQKIYTNNKAGISCLQMSEHFRPDEPIRILYCNERMAQLHGLAAAKDYGKRRYTMGEMLSNLEAGDRSRYIERLTGSIQKRESLLQYRYRVILAGSEIKTVIMNANLTYDNGYVMLDAVVVEDVDSQENMLQRTLQAFSARITSNMGVYLWQYDIDEDVVTFMSQCLPGLEVGRTMMETFDCMEVLFQEKDIPRVEGMLEQLRNGQTCVADEFLMVKRNISEEEKQFHWIALSFERIDSGQGNQRIALGLAEDITEMSENKQRRWRERQYLRMMTEGASFFTEIDVDENRFLDENSNVQLRLFGVYETVNYDQIVQRIVSDVIYPDEASFCTHRLSRDYIKTSFYEGRGEITFDFQAELFQDATYQWYTSSMYLVRNGENGHIYASWQIKNIQREKNKLEEIKNLAEKDQMTGLYNRAVFENVVDQALKAKHRHEKQSAFVMIDVDNFKAINDNFGHSFGDTVLKTIARLLAQIFTEADILARMGGDEFAVFVPQMASEEMMLQKVEEICKKSYTRFDNNGEEIFISCSVGVAFGPEHGMDFQKLYVCADRALYFSKNKGKNQYSIYKGEL